MRPATENGTTRGVGPVSEAMDASTRQLLFRQSIEALRNGRGELASRGFRTLLKRGSDDPKHVSYCGLAVATIDGAVHDGRRLCEYAVRSAGADPEMHLNLALVYERAGWRARAIQAVQSGLAVDPNHPRLLSAYQDINRRKPLLPFLSRDHSLNRYLGRMRSRMERVVSAMAGSSRRRFPSPFQESRTS